MHRSLSLASLMACASIAVAQDAATTTGNWHLFGSSTARTEYYDSDGDLRATPFAFEGLQAYGELDLNMLRQDSAYDRWRGQLSGLIGASDYRSGETGIVPERINLSREKGDVPLRYRVDAGDYFGYFSYRTLQRSLKGVQLELQPSTSLAGGRHSLLLMAGTGQTSWKRLQPADDWSMGASLIGEYRGLGSIGFNLLHNSRQADRSAGRVRRTQQVLSVVAEASRRVLAMEHRLEGELAWFTGDHDGVVGAPDGQGRSDTGLYLQLDGRAASGPDYRLRYENYGRDYRPTGAIVSADRESAEAHLGWRFDSGLYARTRAQRFVDAKESANPVTTHTVGFNLSGALIANTTGRVDLFRQRRDSDNGNLDVVTRDARIDLTRPLSWGWNARLGMLFSDVHDRSVAGSRVISRELSLAADHAIRLGDFRGSIAPGIVVRNVSGVGSRSDDLVPTLALELARGPHRGALNLGYSRFDRRDAGIADVDVYTLSASYDYQRGPDRFGVELDTFERRPRPGQDTEAYRVSVSWTHHFDRPAQRARPAVPALAPSPAAELSAASGPLTLDEFTPGTLMHAVRDRLARADTGSGIQALPGLRVYEARLLDAVGQRQRLATVARGGALERAALIVDFDDVGDVDSLSQIFEKVRRALIDRYGNPTTFYERGAFDDDFARNLNRGRFIRVMEWQLPRGRLRFGIPRRLDRNVRMEAQLARRFRDPRDSLWSLEEVR